MKLLNVLFQYERFQEKEYKKSIIYFAHHSQIESGSHLGILTKQALCTLNDFSIKGKVVMLFRPKITSCYVSILAVVEQRSDLN